MDDKQLHGDFCGSIFVSDLFSYSATLMLQPHQQQLFCDFYDQQLRGQTKKWPIYAVVVVLKGQLSEKPLNELLSLQCKDGLRQVESEKRSKWPSLCQYTQTGRDKHSRCFPFFFSLLFYCTSNCTPQESNVFYHSVVGALQKVYFFTGVWSDTTSLPQYTIFSFLFSSIEQISIGHARENGQRGR